MSNLYWTDRLDPRPAVEAQAQPAPLSVNVPVDELPQRVHELPPPDITLRVANFPPYAERASAFLAARGRLTVRFAETSATPPAHGAAPRYQL